MHRHSLDLSYQQGEAGAQTLVASLVLYFSSCIWHCSGLHDTAHCTNITSTHNPFRRFVVINTLLLLVIFILYIALSILLLQFIFQTATFFPMFISCVTINCRIVCVARTFWNSGDVAVCLCVYPKYCKCRMTVTLCAKRKLKVGACCS